jgi:ribosome-associated toxin RatA of RatAB toxin-antitoxin module
VSEAALGVTPPGEVRVAIDKPSFSSRRLIAATSVRAPPEVLWAALTDYERLGDFIPSLVENRCLERRPRGALLYQVGAQDVALGMQFRAACTLAIEEHDGGLPADMCLMPGSGGDNSGSGAHDRLFPFPSAALPGVPVHGDITFDLQEGDFSAFKGVWRIQPGGLGPDSAWLVYTLYVRPQPWLPVGLIQDRIAKEIVSNLRAVQRHAESTHAAAVVARFGGGSASSSVDGGGGGA